jgi:hypothetical protein
MVFIVAASLGLMNCIGLLIQAFFTHTPAFELLICSSFKSAETQLSGYFSSLFFTVGGLTLFIASNISKLTNIKSKNISCISALIGTVLIFYSFWLFYPIYQLEQERWRYFVLLTFEIGLIVMTLAELVTTERKLFRDFLTLISAILIFAGCMLGAFKNF